MSYGASEGGRDRQSARAAIFIDYEDIIHTLDERPEHHEDAGKLVSEMLEALTRSLLQERGTQAAVSRAYADFANLDGIGSAVQRMLYLQGVESRFVPRTPQPNASEIQLCVDAMDILHHRADIDMFVLLTGRRSYLPLIQHLKRFGRRVLIAALEEPPSLDHVQDLDGEWFFDARDLLSSTSVQVRGIHSTKTAKTENGFRHRKSSQYPSIENPVLIRTLEIIDEHFGHYDEVYLTPLLRKMSEIFDERTCDPKAIVSDLQKHVAVRLEKREGFPHDYTVLIVNKDHPDVARVQQEAADSDPYPYDDNTSWDASAFEGLGDFGSDGLDAPGHGGSDGEYVNDGQSEVGDDEDADFAAFDGHSASNDGYGAAFGDDEFSGDDYDEPSREG